MCAAFCTPDARPGFRWPAPPALRVAVLCLEPGFEDRVNLADFQALLQPGDTCEALSINAFEAMAADPNQAGGDTPDLLLLTRACGDNPLTAPLAKLDLPMLLTEAAGVFHPFHASVRAELRRRGARILPTVAPGKDQADALQAAIAAVRAAKRLRTSHLIVVIDDRSDWRSEHTRQLARTLETTLGVPFRIHTTEALREQAMAIGDREAQAELQRWYAEIFEGPGDMEPAYLLASAKLYLAQRALLEETGAIGISPSDIGGFLLSPTPPPRVMPNLSYAPLVCDGYLVAEEADAGVLATELLLRAALDAHPTMSNLYFAYRDRYDALDDPHGRYSPDLEREDTQQSLRENRLVAAHFSTSGVLPPNMMREARYRVVRTRPSWPDQGMIAGTPRFGPVIVARLENDGRTLHRVAGQIDGLGAAFGEPRYGWYRGRWYIRIDDAAAFADRMLHQHYAIGPENGRAAVLEILAGNLLRLAVI